MFAYSRMSLTVLSSKPLRACAGHRPKQHQGHLSRRACCRRDLGAVRAGVRSSAVWLDPGDFYAHSGATRQARRARGPRLCTYPAAVIGRRRRLKRRALRAARRHRAAREQQCSRAGRVREDRVGARAAHPDATHRARLVLAAHPPRQAHPQRGRHFRMLLPDRVPHRRRARHLRRRAPLRRCAHDALPRHHLHRAGAARAFWPRILR
mmetsp:Transcript_813/g.1662  ORF Transcript_813/g.1662 Transcript_813/m.1662 type:complete len:208 (+) Transcript_813:1070-1693(+)